jgi:hypothetical protein
VSFPSAAAPAPVPTKLSRRGWRVNVASSRCPIPSPHPSSRLPRREDMLLRGSRASGRDAEGRQEGPVRLLQTSLRASVPDSDGRR